MKLSIKDITQRSSTSPEIVFLNFYPIQQLKTIVADEDKQVLEKTECKYASLAILEVGTALNYE